MGTGYFTDTDHQPSPEEIQSALGSTYPLWERMTRFIHTNYQVPGEWSFWGGGWNIRYRKSGKALTALYPQRDSFIAQVVLGKAQAEQALMLDLGEKVGKMLRETPQLRDGKWLFVPILTAPDVEDVEQLLLLKRRPTRRKNP